MKNNPFYKAIDGLFNDKKAREGKSHDDMFKDLVSRFMTRALEEELTEHLGYEKHTKDARDTGNARNGFSKKTIKGDFGEQEINIPRDRNGEFEPQYVKKGQTRVDGFDSKIISLYARGLSTREIEAHFRESYGVNVSSSLISRVTDGVKEELAVWRERPLEPMYPIIFADAMFLKVRGEPGVVSKPLYLLLGIKTDGTKDVLGMWLMESESASGWMVILNELKNRGVQDCFIACIDGLTGLPEAFRDSFPKAEIQLCIVHMVRNSTKYVSTKNRREVIADLKRIYHAPSEALGREQMEAYVQKWGDKYPSAVRPWKEKWDNLSVFFRFPPEIRKVIYTTNPIESVFRELRKTSKTRGVFPNDLAVYKLMYLTLERISVKWSTLPNMREAMNQFEILLPERLP